MKIENGAIFIADAHENEKRDYFWQFLCDIEKEKIVPTQLFLMGDMFDLLVGEVTATHKFAKKYIQKLEFLAKKFPIFYFEGNHDFNLSPFFKNVKVFPLASQPVIFSSQSGNIALLHGDKYEKITYQIYTFFIRNPIICKGLDWLNSLLDNAIYKQILKNQHKKNICLKNNGFEDKVLSKLKYYNLEDIKAIFEGHFHQNKKFKFKNLTYYNFSSFACDKSYFVVQFAPSMKITQFNLRGRNGNSLR